MILLGIEFNEIISLQNPEKILWSLHYVIAAVHMLLFSSYL